MRALLDLVLPVQCAGCGARGVVACPACLAELTSPARLAWPRPSPAGLPPPFAVARYAGPVRGMLLAYKEDDGLGLRRPLGTALGASLETALANTGAASVVVVPVPSTRAARRRRGRDVVMELARVAAGCVRASSGGSVRVVAALRHRRAVADSAGLTAAERAANLSEAFVVRAPAVRLLAGRPVVLVDDLVTTGATLAECARALRHAGAEVVACATVAATVRAREGAAQPAPLALPSG